MGQKYVSYCANKCPASLKANHGNWSYAHLKISKLLRLFGVINLISCATNIPMVFYKHMADLVQNLKSSNTFLTVQHRELKYTWRSTDDLEDFCYLIVSKTRAHLTQRGAFVGGCYRMCKPCECAVTQELLLQLEMRDIADIILEKGKTFDDELSNDVKCEKAITKAWRRFTRHKVLL